MNKVQKEYVAASAVHESIHSSLYALDRDWTDSENAEWSQTRDRMRKAEDSLIDWAMSCCQGMAAFRQVAGDVPKLRASAVYRPKLVALCLRLRG